MMKAIILKKFGSIENLIVQDVPIPQIKENEVLIKVKAISINPVDIKTREGKAQAPFIEKSSPMILGWDISGEIVKKGNKVNLFEIGNEVFGMINFPGNGQGYAEYVAAPCSQIAFKPQNITHEEAASASLAALTAWQAFTTYGRLKQGDKILIHAAAGGVGHFAVQIAKGMGAYVIGTSSAKNTAFVKNLGADMCIDYQNEKFEKILSDIDFVLETQGKDNFGKSLSVLKEGGTIINLPSNLTELSKKMAFENDFTGSLYMKVKSNGNDLKKIADLLEQKIVKPYIFQTYAFDDMRSAHLQIETGHTIGKVAVSI